MNKHMPIVVVCKDYNNFLDLYCELALGHKGAHMSVLTGQSWGIGVIEQKEKEKMLIVLCGKHNKKVNLHCTRTYDHEGIHEANGHTWEDEVENNVMFDNVMFGKVASTKIPRYELIPQSAMDALALIFEKGIERKGEEHAWNALTQQRSEVLQDKMFVVNRLAHVIGHAYSAIRKVMNGQEHAGEEDAGAIMFGGAVLAEYKERRLRRG